MHSEGDAGLVGPVGPGLLLARRAPTRRQRSSRTRAQHFFLPRRFRDPFHTTPVDTESVVDLRRLRPAAGDPRRLATATAGERSRPDEPRPPARLPRAAAALRDRPQPQPRGGRFDALGLVVGTAVMGKPRRSPSGRLAGRRSRRPDAGADRRAHLDRPAGRSARRPRRRDAPASSTTSSPTARASRRASRSRRSSHTLARETHDADLRPASGRGSSTQLRLLRRLRPRDPDEGPGRAGGRAACRARRAGDGRPALGRQRLDGLQQQGQAGPPVRAVLHATAPLRVRRADVGVSPMLFYDPLGRVVATLHPNHTLGEGGLRPWRQETWDVNDTVLVLTRGRTPTSAASSAACRRPSTCRPGMRFAPI